MARSVQGRRAERSIAVPQQDGHSVAHFAPLGHRQIQHPVFIEVSRHDARRSVPVFIDGFLPERPISLTQQDQQFVVSKRDRKIRPLVTIVFTAG